MPPCPPIPPSLIWGLPIEPVGTSNYITKETVLKYELVDLKLPILDNTRSLREGLLKSVSNHCTLKSKMCQKITSGQIWEIQKCTIPGRLSYILIQPDFKNIKVP